MVEKAIYEVDGQIFEFPSSWVVSKIDEWPTYRNHQLEGHKACDLVAYDSEANEKIFFIEVKDYTYHEAKAPEVNKLASAIASKTMGSMGLIYAFSGEEKGNDEERDFCKVAKTYKYSKLVASVELPEKRKKMAESAYLKSLYDELRKKLKYYVDEIRVDSVKFPAHPQLPWQHFRDPETRASRGA